MEKQPFNVNLPLSEFDQMRQRMAEQQKAAEQKAAHAADVARYRAMGLSEGQAEFAASDAMSSVTRRDAAPIPPQQTEQEKQAAKIAGYRAAGMTEGVAEFAAGVQFKGPNVAFEPQ